jgi:hypothetical protein
MFAWLLSALAGVSMSRHETVAVCGVLANDACAEHSSSSSTCHRSAGGSPKFFVGTYGAPYSFRMIDRFTFCQYHLL